jgi:hypothetical protein
MHPAMLSRLYDHDAIAFGAFGDSLRIRNGAVVPPGGAQGGPLWEGVLDEKVTRPERFVRELFSNAGGRLAYLYSTLDHLDSSRRAFAMGFWMRDTGIRLDRFKELVNVAASSLSEWQVQVLPFGRPTHDLSMLLARVRVEDDGASIEPRARVFWSRALDSADIPDDPGKLLRNLHEDGDIDAAWLSSRIITGNVRERELRFGQFTFGQRMFAGTDDHELPNELVGVRGYARFPMLLLALERMGTRNPATVAAAVRHANRLSGLDPNHAFVALSQFQGALALLGRLVRVDRLQPSEAESILGALIATSPTSSGWYQRAVARWIRGPLAQALALPASDIDTNLEHALAGLNPETGVPTVINWEGHRYRVDMADPERRRLRRIRDKTGRTPLDVVFVLDTIAETLAQRTVTLTDIQSMVARLRVFSTPARKPDPSGVDAPNRHARSSATPYKT